MSDTQVYFALYSASCLGCSHLVEGGAKAYVKCHHSKGNKECPAKEVKMVIVGKAKAYANKVLAARDKRHPKTEARLMLFVSTQSEAFKSQFYRALEEGATGEQES